MRVKHIHHEGKLVIVSTLFICLVLTIALNLFYPRQSIYHFVFYFFEVMISFWAVCFFRIPNRDVVILKDSVLAPADGEIVTNEVVHVSEYFNDDRRQISIFMSIYNVHINWYPMDGVVTYRKYNPGKFLVAFKPKSSTENEHNSIVLKDAKGREVLVRQIAGYVARRIVCDVVPGEEAEAGDEFGMIRFGSRLDVFLPLDADVQVKIGDKSRGKRTVLAILK
jgi:phosphatidylserine decarboxylase precursor-related protein